MPKGRKNKHTVNEAHSTSGKDREEKGLVPVPDPEWHDLELLPGSDVYMKFTPPRTFRDALLADTTNWNLNTEPRVNLTISNLVATIIIPRFIDLETWRAHAIQWFKRVCLHRRAMHGNYMEALNELRQRQETLSNRLRKLEEQVTTIHTCVMTLALTKSTESPTKGDMDTRLRHVENSLKQMQDLNATQFTLTANDIKDRASNRREPRQNCQRKGRSLSVGERVLQAQLKAISARSHSPGPDTIKVMAETNTINVVAETSH